MRVALILTTNPTLPYAVRITPRRGETTEHQFRTLEECYTLATRNNLPLPTPYDAGYMDAYESTGESNPYPTDSDESMEWERGFEAGDRDARVENEAHARDQEMAFGPPDQDCDLYHWSEDGPQL